MACSFSVNFSGTAQEFIQRAKDQVSGHGSFNGDASGGNFNVSAMGLSVKGNYSISGSTAKIDVTDKSFLISCDTIRKYVEGHLN